MQVAAPLPRPNASSLSISSPSRRSQIPWQSWSWRRRTTLAAGIQNAQTCTWLAAIAQIPDASPALFPSTGWHHGRARASPEQALSDFGTSFTRKWGIRSCTSSTTLVPRANLPLWRWVFRAQLFRDSLSALAGSFQKTNDPPDCAFIHRTLHASSSKHWRGVEGSRGRGPTCAPSLLFLMRLPCFFFGCFPSHHSSSSSRPRPRIPLFFSLAWRILLDDGALTLYTPRPSPTLSRANRILWPSQECLRPRLSGFHRRWAQQF